MSGGTGLRYLNFDDMTLIHTCCTIQITTRVVYPGCKDRFVWQFISHRRFLAVKCRNASGTI